MRCCSSSGRATRRRRISSFRLRGSIGARSINRSGRCSARLIFGCMAKPNSSDIERALIAKLAGDAALVALLPDGIFYGLAKPNAKRFAIVSLVDPVDRPMFGGRLEDNLYLVKSVGLANLVTGVGWTWSQANQAGYRIEELLDDQPLTVAGYEFIASYRDPDLSRIREPEADETDKSLQWLHAGAYFRVTVATPETR